MFVWAILAAILGLVVFVIWGKEKEKYSSTDELSWLSLVIKFLHKLVKNRKQGVLGIDKSMVYIAGGGDGDYSLVISPKNHKLYFQVVRIDDAHLEKYRKLCGYGPYEASIPLCYVETLFIKPLIALITSAKFCLSPIGLIHIRQTVRQHGDRLNLKNELSLSLEVKQYRQGERGVEVDIWLQAKSAKNNDIVWEGTTTLLSRSGRGKPRPKSYQESKTDYSYTDEISVPGNCGVQFAWLTGDWNPHHLFTLSAWLLGYKKPIAHGMWTLARAIAHIQKEYEMQFKGRHEVKCEFKRPLFMPSDVLVRFDGPDYSAMSRCSIRVEEKESSAPHLIAEIKDF